MKLYLAFKDSCTMMEGYYQNVLGVFDTEKKAWDYLKKTADYKYSKENKSGRVYHFDGELSYYWQVKEIELNKGNEDETN